MGAATARAVVVRFARRLRVLLGRLGQWQLVLISLAIDKFLRVDTVRSEGVENSEIAGTQIYYAGTPWHSLLHLRHELAQLGVGPNDVFVDLGSGKGRAILVAAHFPFGKVVGVELSGRLHKVALANCRTMTSRLQCANVDLINQDATTFTFPTDVTVIYMYNPFKGRIFEAVMDQITASLDALPRVVTIIYANPVMHSAVLARGFQVTRDLKYMRIYRWSPSA